MELQLELLIQVVAVITFSFEVVQGNNVTINESGK